MKLDSKVQAVLSGHIKVSKCPFNLDPTVEANKQLLHEGKNLIVNQAQDALVGLLKGDAGYLPKYISLGSGGDFLQGTKTDIGSQVPAVATSTALRNAVYRIPISMVTDEVDNTWTFVAIARPEEAVLPVINEFGVETENQTMISHVVSPAALDGRATRYTKTSLEFLIVEWTYTFVLTLAESVQTPVVSI